MAPVFGWHLPQLFYLVVRGGWGLAQDICTRMAGPQGRSLVGTGPAVPSRSKRKNSRAAKQVTRRCGATQVALRVQPQWPEKVKGQVGLSTQQASAPSPALSSSWPPAPAGPHRDSPAPTWTHLAPPAPTRPHLAPPGPTRPHPAPLGPTWTHQPPLSLTGIHRPPPGATSPHHPHPQEPPSPAVRAPTLQEQADPHRVRGASARPFTLTWWELPPRTDEEQVGARPQSKEAVRAHE